MICWHIWSVVLCLYLYIQHLLCVWCTWCTYVNHFRWGSYKSWSVILRHMFQISEKMRKKVWISFTATYSHICLYECVFCKEFYFRVAFLSLPPSLPPSLPQRIDQTLTVIWYPQVSLSRSCRGTPRNTSFYSWSASEQPLKVHITKSEQILLPANDIMNLVLLLKRLNSTSQLTRLMRPCICSSI